MEGSALTAEKPDLLYVQLLAESKAAPQSDGVSGWFTILTTGERPWQGETITVTQSDLEKAVENFRVFQEKGIDLPIDYDHSFQLSGDSKAAGWYHDLKAEPGRLMARVKWTKTAAEAIKNEEYKYFSSEYHETYAHHDIGDDLGFTILSGGLTNRPHLKGMGAVALTEKAADSVKETAIALGEMAGFDMVAEPRSELPDRVKDPADKTVETKEIVALAEAKAGDAVILSDDHVVLTEADHKKLVDQAKKGEEAASEVTTLSETVKEQGKTITDEKFARIFGEHQRRGAVDAKDETKSTWRERVDKYGLDEVEKLLSELPGETVPVTERGAGGDSQDEAKPGLGTPEGEAAMLKKAEEIVQSEENVTLAEALERVEREVAGTVTA